jgi:hypothetical protein
MPESPLSAAGSFDAHQPVGTGSARDRSEQASRQVTPSQEQTVIRAGFTSWPPVVNVDGFFCAETEV